MRTTDIPGFGNLSQPEKNLLAEEIWSDIASDPSSVPVPESHLDELNRRVQRHRAKPGKLLSLDELQQRLQARR